MKTREDLIRELENKISFLESEKSIWANSASYATFEVAIANCYIALSNLHNGKP